MKEIPYEIRRNYSVLSGLAATSAVHPLELLKNRMQIAKAREYRTSYHLLVQIIKNEGIRSIYSGLSAGIAKEFSFLFLRVALYEKLSQLYFRKQKAPPGILINAFYGVAASSVAALVTTPFEVSLVRMTIDGRAVPESQFRYTNVGNALVQIGRDEGFNVWYRGMVPTVLKAGIHGGVHFTTYMRARKGFLDSGYFNDDHYLHVSSAVVSGIATSLLTLPVDMVKTRMQNMVHFDYSLPEYAHSLDCLKQTIKHEGMRALWRGFTPYCLRVTSYSIVSFLAWEKLKDFWWFLGTLDLSEHGIDIQKPK